MTWLYDVPFFGPPIPKKGVFDKKEEFGNFLLAKCKDVMNIHILQLNDKM